MYPIENIYSELAHNAWRSAIGAGGGVIDRRNPDIDDSAYWNVDLRDYRQPWYEIRDGSAWRVRTWDELRTAVSFLTLMNKRLVMYYRGQGTHHKRCTPVLFRDEWFLEGERYPLGEVNRFAYYESQQSVLRAEVLQVAQDVGTPRSYILKHVPSASASILQHYELWPTHFVDITRSLPTAVAFAEGDGTRKSAHLYVVGLPDLRGSITSDMDQHLTLARLEAICPPDAKRPHHQDAYLASRFPEPLLGEKPGGSLWDDWQNKTNLMRRVVAKFHLHLSGGRLAGAPRVEGGFLIPPLSDDRFGNVLTDRLLPIVKKLAAALR